MTNDAVARQIRVEAPWAGLIESRDPAAALPGLNPEHNDRQLADRQEKRSVFINYRDSPLILKFLPELRELAKSLTYSSPKQDVAVVRHKLRLGDTLELYRVP